MEGGGRRARGVGCASSAPRLGGWGVGFTVGIGLLGIRKVLLALFEAKEIELVDMPVAENVGIGTVDLFVFGLVDLVDHRDLFSVLGILGVDTVDRHVVQDFQVGPAVVFVQFPLGLDSLHQGEFL